jgi:hypothetical protein
MAKKNKKAPSILEAIDHLSHLAELDLKAEKEPGEEQQRKIQATFETLNTYLRHLYQKERAQLAQPKTQRAIRAMMQLADEAVDKVKKYTQVFNASIPEYDALHQFYTSKIGSQLRKGTEKKLRSEESSVSSAEQPVLKDLESVRHDREYEFFYIHKEDGMPFFNPDLLRHLRLVGQFDESFAHSETDNPLIRMDVVLDRDFHESAKEILKEAEGTLQEFCKEARKHKEMPFVAALNMSMMALMLAANPKNLSHQSSGKKCFHYFSDFHRFLREALKSEEYRKLRGVPAEEIEPYFRALLKTAHALCAFLFFRIGTHPEILQLIHNLTKSAEKGGVSLWKSLLEHDAALREELSKYPSGPLLKILTSFQEERDQEGFDPLLQHNAPSQLFSIASESLHTSVLHLPCPVHQEFIDKAEIAEEFKGFLRYLGEKRHLLINLQDRTSWKEHQRSVRLEELAKEAEFGRSFRTVTLPKDTAFYHQAEEYAALDDGKEFCAQLQQQVDSGSQCGFFIDADLTGDIPKIIRFIHEHMFENKAKLSRQERLDFIEIFYFFLVLTILDKEQSDIISFTCKDGIDTGAAASSAFYGFSRMLSSSKPWSTEDKNFFLFSLYAPALLVRHRAIDVQRLHRSLSALEHFETTLQHRREKTLQACAELFPDFPIQKLKVTEAA